MSLAYAAARDPLSAIASLTQHPGAEFIAGGTDMLQLLEERVRDPAVLVDINGALGADIAETIDGLRIGAGARLSDVADDPTIRERFPVLARALQESASGQVRNMATLGGNLLQRTRCLYFRDVTTPCNKRAPGTGCGARGARDRINAVLGGSPHCHAAYPGDLAVALLVLDAEVMVRGRNGERTIPVGDLHVLPGDTPHVETVLERGDLIEAVFIPREAAARASHYEKVRDRATFEWAVASAAVALAVVEGEVAEARVGLGGVATKPWRARAVEEALKGRRLTPDTVREAASHAADGAVEGHENGFKIPLIRRTVERALLQAGGLA